MDPLSVPEVEVLRHIHRYRLTTPQALCRVFSASAEEIETVLRSLHRRRLIDDPQPLYGEVRYYELSSLAFAEVFGADTPFQPLSPSAMMKAYSILHFCCLGRAKRRRVLSAEWEEAFPALSEKGLPAADYYTEDTPAVGLVLGLMYVDRSSPEGDLHKQAYRVIGRCEELLKRRCRMEAFQQLIARREFRFTVITATAEKAQCLRIGFKRRELPLKPRVEVVPELAELHTQQLRAGMAGDEESA